MLIFLPFDTHTLTGSAAAFGLALLAGAGTAASQ
jgi:hypothetical protein